MIKLGNSRGQSLFQKSKCIEQIYNIDSAIYRIYYKLKFLYISQLIYK